MSLPLLMVRRGAALHPADDLAAEDMCALPNGKPILIEARNPRSLQQHRLLFALIRKVANSTPTPMSEHALRQWLTVRSGHVDVLPLAFGKTYDAPRSWAFDKMTQADFRQLFNDVVNLILTEVCPNLPDDFANEFLSLLDDRGAEQSASRRERAA